MSLLHRAPAQTCPQCGHPRLGPVQRALEPLVWSQHCCHVLVDDPWSYYGDDECGCSGELHQPRLLAHFSALTHLGHLGHLGHFGHQRREG